MFTWCSRWCFAVPCDARILIKDGSCASCSSFRTDQQSNKLNRGFSFYKSHDYQEEERIKCRACFISNIHGMIFWKLIIIKLEFQRCFWKASHIEVDVCVHAERGYIASDLFAIEPVQAPSSIGNYKECIKLNRELNKRIYNVKWCYSRSVSNKRTCFFVLILAFFVHCME